MFSDKVAKFLALNPNRSLEMNSFIGCLQRLEGIEKNVNDGWKLEKDKKMFAKNARNGYLCQEIRVLSL